MKIIVDYPPNIAEIRKRFDLEGFNLVFAYGNILYNPSGQEISEDLMVHEETHQKQQFIYGVGDWWVRYLNDDGFRLSQEVEAYREQYKFIKENYDRARRREKLHEIAKVLASKLYGKIINKQEAKELIENA